MQENTPTNLASLHHKRTMRMQFQTSPENQLLIEMKGFKVNKLWVRYAICDSTVDLWFILSLPAGLGKLGEVQVPGQQGGRPDIHNLYADRL